LFSSTVAGRQERSLSLISKSPFLNYLNQFAHVLIAITFSIRLTNNSEKKKKKKKKSKGKYALYLTPFLIILNVRLYSDIYDIVHNRAYIMHK